MSDNRVKEALEKSFEDLLKKINTRFDNSAGQLKGLGDWIRAQLQKMQNNFREVKLHYEVADLSISSLVELLEEKGLITSEEYDQKTQELFERTEKASKDKK